MEIGESRLAKKVKARKRAEIRKVNSIDPSCRGWRVQQRVPIAKSILAATDT